MSQSDNREKEDKQEVCGHVNLDSFGIDGKPDNLSCTLPKGHAGDHCAPHKERRYSALRQDPNHPKIPTGEQTEDVEVLAYWNDTAGIPKDKRHQPVEIPPPTMLEQDFGPDVAKQIII